MNETVLIVHGLGGSGPDHWQTWLWQRLLERGVDVSYLDLPDPDEPKLEAWLDVLEEELGSPRPRRPGRRMPFARRGDVASPRGAHATGASPSASCWSRRPARARASPEIAEFVPAPLDAEAVARAAGSTRVVCSDSGDPYRPEGPELFEPLGVPIDVIPGGGHLNTDAGYGEWPAVEAWCLDPGAAPIAGR